MYSIPVILNQRRLIHCDLDRKETKDGNSTQYIVPVSIPQATEVLRIPATGWIFPIKDAPSGPVSVQHLSAKVSFPRPDLIRVLLSRKQDPAQPSLAKTESNGKFDLRLAPSLTHEGERDILLKSKPNPTQSKIWVEFIYISGTGPKAPAFTSKILLHLAKPLEGKETPNIWEAILDMGTAATQIRIKSPEETEFRPLDITREIEEHFYGIDLTGIGIEKVQEYYQHLPDSEAIGSHAFIRQRGGSASLLDPPEKPTVFFEVFEEEKLSFRDTREFVNLLIPKAMKGVEENRFISPSLKLSPLKHSFDHRLRFLHEEENPEKDLGTHSEFKTFLPTVRRIAWNKLLHVVLKSIESRLAPHNRPHLRIGITLSSLYDSVTQANLLQTLRKDLATLLPKANVFPEGKIEEEAATYAYPGVEIVPIFEGDAAFLGSNPEIAANETHLVIDCGHGTTDLSMIRTTQLLGKGAQGTAVPIFRTSFIGGGSEISWAFLETALGLFLAEESGPRKQFLQEQIMQATPFQQLALFQLMEQLKWGFSDRTRRKQVPSTEVLEKESGFWEFMDAVEAHMELHPDGATLHDELGWIKSAIHSLTSKIEEALKLIKKEGIKFNSIHLSGGAFRFAPLAKVLRKKLAPYCVDWTERTDKEGSFPFEKRIMYKPEAAKAIALPGIMGETMAFWGMDMLTSPIIDNQGHQPKPKSTKRLLNIFSKPEKLPEDPHTIAWNLAQVLLSERNLTTLFSGIGPLYGGAEVSLRNAPMKLKPGASAPAAGYRIFAHPTGYYAVDREGKTAPLLPFSAPQSQFSAEEFKAVFPFIQLNASIQIPVSATAWRGDEYYFSFMEENRSEKSQNAARINFFEEVVASTTRILATEPFAEGRRTGNFYPHEKLSDQPKPDLWETIESPETGKVPVSTTPALVASDPIPLPNSQKEEVLIEQTQKKGNPEDFLY